MHLHCSVRVFDFSFPLEMQFFTGVEKENDLKGVMSAVAQLGQKSLDPRLKKLNERFKALMVPNADISPGDLPEKTKESLIW